MADGITLTLDDSAAQAHLAQLVRAADNAQDAFSAIGAYMVTSTQRRFERETGPDGVKWRQLSPRTAAKRVGRTRRGHEHILRVKARLYSSITYESDADQVRIGTNLPYAAIHQLGGVVKIPEREQEINLSTGKGRKRFVKASAKRRDTRRVKIGAHTITIPGRPYLGADDADLVEIRAIVEDHFRSEAE